MINNVVLAGRLTKNVELRYTGGGIAVANFTLAVERNFTNASGERETDFINCVIWRKSAETLSQFAVKGSLISVIGSIETGSYEKDGQTVYTTEVSCQNFQMLESKAVNEQRRKSAGGNSNYNNNGNYNQNQNTGNNNQNAGNNSFNTDQNPFETTDDVTDISDDDLPF